MSRLPLNKILIVLLTLLLPGLAIAADEEAEPEKSPAYVSLGKPMVLNLSTDSRRLTFLQIAADVLVNNDEAREVVESHIPAIRHKLIVMLSERPAADMKSSVAREGIRNQVTEGVRNMIKEMTDNNDVEEVLFTTFLVQ